MMDIRQSLITVNVNIDAAPISKLIETVGRGIGQLTDHWVTVPRARAETKAGLIRAEGQLKIADVERRARERAMYVELRRQLNIESIVLEAAFQLPDALADEEVDEDWIVEFFNHSQDIRDEQMQLLWARVLAGEVARPGSYSFRTLRAVKMLRPADAQLFTVLTNFVWRFQARFVVFHNEQTEPVLAAHGVSRDRLLHLQSLGLLSRREHVGRDYETGASIEMSYFENKYTVANPQSGSSSALMAHVLSDIGQELQPLCDSRANREYEEAVLKRLRDAGIGLALA